MLKQRNTDQRYSTTRLLMSTKPVINNNTDDKFTSHLFLPENNQRSAEGGLRTKGLFKSSKDDKPLITIITVVFNGEKYLEETIQSVINQSYENVEYIVIDGGSTDSTLDIIKKYDAQIDYWVSEPDKGIYYAMNKGITLSSGDWINFMNAGDSFFKYITIQEVFIHSVVERVDLIYGNHNVIYSDKTRIVKAGSILNIWKGSQFCHQSAFVRSAYHKSNLFNVKNRIVADFEFFYKYYEMNKQFKYIDVIVVNYLAGGLSDIQRFDSIVGFWNIVEKNTKVNMFYVCAIIKETIKTFIKKVLKI